VCNFQIWTDIQFCTVFCDSFDSYSGFVLGDPICALTYTVCCQPQGMCVNEFSSLLYKSKFTDVFRFICRYRFADVNRLFVFYVIFFLYIIYIYIMTTFYTVSQKHLPCFVYLCQKLIDFNDFWRVKSSENLTWKSYRFVYLTCQCNYCTLRNPESHFQQYYSYIRTTIYVISEGNKL